MTSRLALIGAVLALSTGDPAPAQEKKTEQPRPSRTCDVGPVSKSFGGSQWFVFGCDDRKTVVIVAAPGSPAAPFYFMFFPQGGDYQLYGEGTGSKDATAAASKELGALSPQQISALVAEANAGKR